MMDYGRHGYGYVQTAYGPDPLAMLFGLAIIAAVVVAVVLLVRMLVRGTASHNHAGSGAREALDVRYAKGEITRDEYLTIQADIWGSEQTSETKKATSDSTDQEPQKPSKDK